MERKRLQHSSNIWDHLECIKKKERINEKLQTSNLDTNGLRFLETESKRVQFLDHGTLIFKEYESY